MQHDESIYEVYKRFPHVVNNLVTLGKKFDTRELNIS